MKQVGHRAVADNECGMGVEDMSEGFGVKQLGFICSQGFARGQVQFLMRTVVVGTPTDRHQEMYLATREALAAVETQLVPGKTFGDVFDAHAERMDSHGMMPHRLNACGYSLGARFTPSWMDTPMAYKANPALVKPNMVIFMHMILMDSITGTAMTLGQTYLTGEGAPECLSTLPLDLPVKSG